MTEPSTLSQQLAVLRRYGIVRSRRDGSTVVYEIASQNKLLTELRDAETASPGVPLPGLPVRWRKSYTAWSSLSRPLVYTQRS